jgi:succinyl-CoA synthetase beta subunit
VAQGVVEAASAMRQTIPIVVRMEGTNAEQGRKILSESGLKIIVADGMRDAAEKVVAAAK